MARLRALCLTFRRLGRDDRGVALVEFGMILPLMLLFLALAVEGGRTFWSYQTAIAGVRDATRYLSRALGSNACSAGADVAGYSATLLAIVTQGLDGEALLPPNVQITGVTPTLACISGDFRVDPAPVATVTADLTIAYPFAGIFGLVGAPLATVTTTVTDSTRVFGA